MDIASTIQRLSNREKGIIAFTVVFVLIFLPYTFMYEPAQEAIKDKREQLNDLTLEISKLNSMMIVKVGEETIGDLPMISLPQAQNLAGMLKAISLEAERSGVEFVSVTQQGYTQKGRYLEMRLKLELKSRYKPLNNFVRRLGEKQRLFMIDSLRYETNEALYPSGVAILSAVTYLERE